MTGISVIFPCYNEELVLEETIIRALGSLREQFNAFEVILVNDASRDTTPALCDRLAAAHSEIRVLHNPRNIGQGASIVRGFREARYPLVLHNGVDYPFDLADLRIMMPLLSEADIVVAARRARPGYSPYRIIASFVHRTLLHLLFPLKLSDYNFVQLYPRSVWEDINVEARSTAFLTPEALIRAHDMGYRVREVEIEYHARTAGVATAGRPKVIIASLRDMLRFWWRRLFRRTSRRSVVSNSHL
jgi:glycosyltransferase involved in cell wall biosynthesis